MLKNALKRRRLTILLTVSLALVAAGLAGLWQFRPVTTVAPDPQVVATSTDAPSEAIIDPKSEYKVAPDQPRRIIMPAIEASGFIQRVGTDKTGAVAVPSSIHMAGWFVSSAKPGDKGLSLIDGHVSGKIRPGIFKRLKELRPGDSFDVEFGDLSRRKFTVVSVTAYKAADATLHLFDQQAGIENQLNLITCGGRFDPKTEQYEDRILVVSRRG
jgi:sortase (surface protein transpeptidase)